MRYLGLACIALIPNIFVAGHLGERGAAEPWRCLAKGVPEDGVCSEPIEDVVQVDAQVYTTKLRCKDCPHSALGSDHDSEVLRSDHDLLFNISRSPNAHAILLNDHQIFPKLSTIPTPPRFRAAQVLPTFSYTNLSTALTCEDNSCLSDSSRWDGDACWYWCYNLTLGWAWMDYVYSIDYIDRGKTGESVIEQPSWKIDFDVLALYPGNGEAQVFNSTPKKMLRVHVRGIDIDKIGENRPAGDGSLFDPLKPKEKVYRLDIFHVEWLGPENATPSLARLTLWGKISRFFGNDVWNTPDQLIYIYEDWGYYGKKGTLRDLFGQFVHWDYWPLIWTIVPSTIAGLLAIYALYKLYFWIQEQRELMKWNGMDNVWDNMRRDQEEEENALLSERYRDEPDEGSSSRPSGLGDDFDTMKPLPTKPLPEKPLPDVPLIDP